MFSLAEVRRGPGGLSPHLRSAVGGRSLSILTLYLSQACPSWPLRLSVRKRFLSRVWALEQALQSSGHSCCCWSSRKVWTMLSDAGFDLMVVLCGAKSWALRSLWVPSSLGYSVILDSVTWTHDCHDIHDCLVHTCQECLLCDCSTKHDTGTCSTSWCTEHARGASSSLITYLKACWKPRAAISCARFAARFLGEVF